MANTPKGKLSKRTIANRANAKKSTGPKTEEGKAKSSQNALKHGLTAAKHIETVFDEPGQFEAHKEGLLQHFNPQTHYEAALVDRIITLMWRLRRIPIIEALVMQGKLQDTRLHSSMAYLRSGGALEFLHLSRYEANLDRCLHRALKDLADSRTTSSAPNSGRPMVNGQSSMVNLQNEPNEPNSADTGRQSLVADFSPHTNRQSLVADSHSHSPVADSDSSSDDDHNLTHTLERWPSNAQNELAARTRSDRHP